MPHIRQRFLAENLKKLLRWSPSVSLMGMRQVGKTTLVRQLAHSYFSFDDEKLFLKAMQSNWFDIEGAKAPVVIDEVQKYPPTFDRIKLWIDENKRPGRFLLTGSVRFSDRKGIKESLTGRTVIAELLPLTVAESRQKPLSYFLANICRHSGERLLEVLHHHAWLNQNQLNTYLERGGLPGICFLRETSHRNELWNAHLETVLTRDLDLIYKTKLPLEKRMLLFSLIASLSGQTIEASPLARRVGCSQPTLKELLSAYEGLFLIRPFGRTYFCEDHGLNFFARRRSFEDPRSQMLRFVFNELHAQLLYKYRNKFEWNWYKSRGGIDIPFFISLTGHKSIAISIDSNDGASDKNLKGLTWYKKRYPKKNVVGIVLHKGSKAYISSQGIPCIPWNWIA